jgi:hypothetical protein
VQVKIVNYGLFIKAQVKILYIQHFINSRHLKGKDGLYSRTRHLTSSIINRKD